MELVLHFLLRMYDSWAYHCNYIFHSEPLIFLTQKCFTKVQLSDYLASYQLNTSQYCIYQLKFQFPFNQLRTSSSSYSFTEPLLVIVIQGRYENSSAPQLPDMSDLTCPRSQSNDVVLQFPESHFWHRTIRLKRSVVYIVVVVDSAGKTPKCSSTFILNLRESDGMVIPHLICSFTFEPQPNSYCFLIQNILVFAFVVFRATCGKVFKKNQNQSFVVTFDVVVVSVVAKVFPKVVKIRVVLVERLDLSRPFLQLTLRARKLLNPHPAGDRVSFSVWICFVLRYLRP